jgi:hypothetical protein
VGGVLLLLLPGRPWRRGGGEAARHLLPSLLVTGACSWDVVFFLLFCSCWLHGGGSGDERSSSSIWCEFKGASLRRLVTVVPRLDSKGVGHPLPLLHLAVQATLSLLRPKWLVPRRWCNGWCAATSSDLAGEPLDLIAFLYASRVLFALL